MGNAIYQPAGRAGEYAEWAANVYRGCDHKCAYCYCPLVLKMDRQAFYKPSPRPTFLRDLERDAKKYAGQITTPILLSFTCDPYQEIDVTWQHTRRTLEILRANDLSFQTLTKGGRRALRDLDLFRPGVDMFASSLTLVDQAASEKWERDAAPPQERMDVLREFHEAGVRTWASLEPVIDPAQTLELIRQTHEYVSLYKVGTINYTPNVSKAIDWEAFAVEVVSLLEGLGKEFYVKDDLRRHLDAASDKMGAPHAHP